MDIRTPSRSSPRGVAAAILCGLLLMAAGCGPLVDGSTGASPAGPSAGAGGAASLQLLAALPMGTWASMSGYTREKFPLWNSQGGGCNTRDVVLKTDGQGVTATTDCKITRGTWYSLYDGKSFTNPQDLDIDHMVPLANAWRTGAKDWTDAKRSQFANDLTHPQLLAVSASANRSKGDQDPSEWKPPRQAYWCVYAQRWVAVKDSWKLFVTTAEKAALQQMLDTCT